MAAFNIEIKEGFFVTTDSPPSVQFIKNTRALTTFEFNDIDDSFQFFFNIPLVNGTTDNRILGNNETTYLFTDLNTVTETINGVPTVIPIANAAALDDYLSQKLGFFFNPSQEVNGGVDGLLTQDFLIEVGKDNVPGHSIVVIEGRNIDVDMAIVDIGMEDVNFTWLTAAATLEVLSDDINDTSAGTGARSVKITGLDTNFDIISETLATNGTTPVVTVNDYIRINEFEIENSGTYASTTSGSNAGNITLRVSVGGATQSFISNDLLGNGHHQDGKFTVPNNHIAIVLGLGLNVDSTKSAKLFFQSRPEADRVIAPFSSKVILGVIDGASGRNEMPREELGVVLQGKSDIWASAIAVANDTEVSIRIALLLINQS